MGQISCLTVATGLRAGCGWERLNVDFPPHLEDEKVAADLRAGCAWKPDAAQPSAPVRQRLIRPYGGPLALNRFEEGLVWEPS